MTRFDHDSAGRRGVDRQRVVEDELNTLRGLVGSSFVHTPTRELFLGIELLKKLNDPMQRGVESKHLSAITTAADLAEQTIAREAKSPEEYNKMMLDLAQKMIAGATTCVLSNFSTWESNTFRA